MQSEDSDSEGSLFGSSKPKQQSERETEEESDKSEEEDGEKQQVRTHRVVNPLVPSIP